MGISTTIWIISLLLFNLILAVIIFFLWRKEKKHRDTEDQEVEDNGGVHPETQQYLYDSIRIITLSMRKKECPLPEGCIRLKVLLDNYAPKVLEQEQFKIIEEVYQLISHVPTHQKWQELTKEEREKYRSLLDKVEQEHAAQVDIALVELEKTLLN